MLKRRAGVMMHSGLPQGHTLRLEDKIMRLLHILTPCVWPREVDFACTRCCCKSQAPVDFYL